MSASWVAEAERKLARLRDIVAASITMDGDQIREIHVVAESTRAPKNIVRDVETALKAFLKRDIDHRMISVAVTAPDGTVPAPAANVTQATSAGTATKSGTVTGPAPPSSPSPGPAPVPPPAPAVVPVTNHGTPATDLGRVRFGNANLFVSGLRTQAEVELSWQGTTRVGNATGASARDNAFRLLSSATLSALAPFLGPDITLAPHDVEFVRLGRKRWSSP
jgi:hypothetical protein